MYAGQWPEKAAAPIVLIGAAVMAVTIVRHRVLGREVAGDHRPRFARGRRLRRGRLVHAVKLARQTLAIRKEDPDALRLTGQGICPARPRRGRHGHLSATDR